MKLGTAFRLACVLALVASAQTLTAAELTLPSSALARFARLQRGEAQMLKAFPAGPTTTASVQFQRVQIYADGARILLVSQNGSKELPRSDRIFLRGHSADGSVRVAMSLNRDGSFAEGSGSGPEGAFELHSRTGIAGARILTAQMSTTPPGFQFSCGNENIDFPARPVSNLASQLRRAVDSGLKVAPSPSVSSFRYATVAIDTDSLFMSRLFSNNQKNATNWIAGMFNSMNAMYETDLNVQLLIGTTILRTSAAGDPYTGLSSGAASTADLDVFGSYWKTNEGSVARSFAILLSGAIPSSGSSCSAAGIAWVDEYCDTGFAFSGHTVGSYSVTKVCTSIGIDPNGSFDAHIVGHEIGHNFGAFHTHCTDVSNGNAPVATNTIDTCYNGEGATHTTGGQCYDGATSCPAGGHGTIMSYCNISGCGTQNNMQFHATQVNDVLLPEIAANTPSCLAASDVIFADGFQ